MRVSLQSKDLGGKKRQKRPKNKQRQYYSGKKKRHTQKVQLIIDQKDTRILCTDFAHGTRHDFALFKDSVTAIHSSITILADSGYTGLVRLHTNTQLIIKGRRNHPLTKREKARNKTRSKKRMPVEHVIGTLKVFRILSERYRNRRKRFGLRFNLIAGIYNIERGLV
jgi:hypothetical protein